MEKGGSPVLSLSKEENAQIEHCFCENMQKEPKKLQLWVYLVEGQCKLR